MPSTVNEFSAPLAPLTWKPPSTSPELTDGAVSAIDWKERPFGRRSNSSAVTLWRDERAPRIDQRGGFRGDLHGFGQRADPHLRVEFERAPEEDADVGPFHPRETCELERYGVAPGVQILSDCTGRWRR